MQVLTISKSAIEALKAHASEGFPSETVGILAGDASKHLVSVVKPLINERADTNNRYRVNGLIVHRASQALETEGFDILGYYHSHPNHPSQYSDYDRDHALPNLSYVIVSVMEGNTETIQSWRLTEDRSQMLEEPVQIV